MKYYYNDNGAEMIRIDVRKNDPLVEWYEYPLHKVAKLPKDPEERKQLKELFFDTFVEMQKLGRPKVQVKKLMKCQKVARAEARTEAQKLKRPDNSPQWRQQCGKGRNPCERKT
ncbi:Oidioi.mRNA.OKI2018_I69.PAR.g9717.t1.cds [Oikopleura dioica]|uniref:Oidioi.mRNA.OKI2018_I69.PAR.g9717.t1.cds n=1 Tax=Oikopleura dioica TaxID=34765 RepID=A0ABN7RR30_OIKDI|nr:Oidioi.mRNA.OKI2018_I69.PAR.g9717.t1.cds [Oikopleura dioica]